MKLLMIYAQYFAFKPAQKTLDYVPDASEKQSIENAVVGFVHVEEKDSHQMNKIITKLIKNLKWLAEKNNNKNIVFHSFAHLSEEKADPQLAAETLNQAEQRLIDAGYNVGQTPLGYFLDLDLKVPGSPLARVFKEF